MRVLQWKRNRVIKFVGIAFVALVFLLVVVRSYYGENDGANGVGGAQELHGGLHSAHRVAGQRRVPHQSYPNELPKFLGQGNRGNFEPRIPTQGSGPGEMGKAHNLRVDQKDEEEKLKGVYGFNQLVSDEISLNRSVPDMREEECRAWDYPTDLPKASVVLVFHNEGWSTLLRTVNSVLNRSPPEFLEEVLLVDDKSELEHLHTKLENEIKKPYYKGRVNLIRNSEREGLIRSRNNGAVAAKGEVVVFLDAHCEVNYNWLPPLLAPIHADR